MRIILLTISLISLVHLQAQWTTVIGDSVSVRGLTSRGDTIIAGTSTGKIFISPDLGETWMERSEGLPEAPIKNIGVSENGSILCNIGPNIWRSSDWYSWEDVYQSGWNGGLSLAVIDSLILYGAEIAGGLHVSMDNGDTWSIIGTGYISGVGASGDTIYIGKFNTGVFRSWDHGENWELAPNTPTPLYALSDDGRFAANEQNIYRRGLNNSWSLIHSTTAQQLTAFATSPPSVAAGGNTSSIYLSTDNGDSWAPLAMPDNWTRRLEFAGGYLFAACNGLLRMEHDVLLTVPEAPEAVHFSIFPNPTSGVLRVVLNGDLEETIIMDIHDATGRTVLSSHRSRSTEKHALEIAGFAPGLYTIAITFSNGSRYARSFIVE